MLPPVRPWYCDAGRHAAGRRNEGARLAQSESLTLTQADPPLACTRSGWRVALDVAQALAFLHDGVGVVHFDVKSAVRWLERWWCAQQGWSSPFALASVTRVSSCRQPHHWWPSPCRAECAAKLQRGLRQAGRCGPGAHAGRRVAAPGCAPSLSPAGLLGLLGIAPPPALLCHFSQKYSS